MLCIKITLHSDKQWTNDGNIKTLNVFRKLQVILYYFSKIYDAENIQMRVWQEKTEKQRLVHYTKNVDFNK